ncbi:MAG: YncE family protein [Caulobacteraceae bacterium]
MRKLLKRLGLGLAGLVALGLVVAVVIITALALPGVPAPDNSLRFVGFVPLPNSGRLLSILDYLTVNGRTLYVTSESTGDVYEVPLSAGALPTLDAVRTAHGEGAAHGVAIDPVSRLAFVTRSDVNHVDVFDPTSLRTLKSIGVADDVDGALYDPADKLIYAVNGDPNSATLIDPATRTNVGTVALGGKPEFAVFDPQTRLIYQNLADRNVVAVVDPAKRAVLDRWSLGPCQRPSSIALDQANRRLFVVCSGNALLVVLDLASHRTVASLAIGGGPDSVAYDAGLRRIYATGKSGVLSAVQQDGPDAYRLLTNVNLHYGAHTLAVDPSTHRIYVAYASLLSPPRLAVFEPLH